MRPEALVLESLAIARFLREPHPDHVSQEGAFAASESIEPLHIVNSSMETFPKRQRGGEQASLDSGTQHTRFRVYPTSCKSGCMNRAFKNSHIK